MRRSALAPAVAAAALAACATPAPPQQLSPKDQKAAAAFQPGALAGGADGGFETGRLTSPEQAVAGPFVLTYLAPGAQVEVSSTGAGSAVVGAVTGPLPQPLHVARGMVFRLPAPGEAVYAGYRPMPVTRPLEGWVGRPIAVSSHAAGPAEAWTLREIAGDHVTLERSRTYRVIPVRRIAEIAWTDLAGVDPTPRLVIAAE